MKNHSIVIGEAKCGTSSLHKYMNQHPKVCSKKEINFFEKNNSITNYFDLFDKTEYTIENSPKYFRHRGMAKKISNLLPNIKIILLLRNPIDRLYSNYNMNKKFHNGINHIKDFESYVGYPNQPTGYLNNNINNYYSNLIEWYDFFDRNSIFIIKSEDLFENTNEITNEIFGFIGVDSYKINDTKPLIPYYRGKNVKPKEHYPPINIKTKEWLREYFKEKNVKLYDLIERDMLWD